ncbi:dATP/dGTP diphosphohydrolase domain-containing protein, partial [Cutibacterium acnes]
VDALYRHLLSWQQGNNLDHESGLPHLAHAAWHCLALLAYQQHNAGQDTRNPWNKSDQ